eukprot:10088409-Alexandrium_andersonii.AAC.1
MPFRLHWSSEFKNQQFKLWSDMFKQLHSCEVSCSGKFRTCTMASRVRTWNCAGPRTASESLPEATEGWIKCRRRLRGFA